jgi:hypothetical protein
MNQPTCPHCNKSLVISVAITKEEPTRIISYITRKEMAEDGAKPIDERQYVEIEYIAKSDRYKVYNS